MPSASPSPATRFTTAGWRAWAVRAWAATLDLLYPPCCAVCGRVDATFCPDCTDDLAALPATPGPSVRLPHLTVYTTGTHTGLLREAVLALKFNAGLHVAPVLGTRLAAVARTLPFVFDTVVPVPLHATRLQERGYNQAQVLAAVLAEQGGWRHQPDAVRRVHFARAQVGLNAVERQQNVAGAFVAHPQTFVGRRVLIVDDVCTTGATLSALADSLLSVGARAVCGLTVTRAL